MTEQDYIFFETAFRQNRDLENAAREYVNEEFGMTVKRFDKWYVARAIKQFFETYAHKETE